MSASSPSFRPRALGGLALASLFLIGHATGFAHRLIVRHSICAEHGEVIHTPRTIAATAGPGRELRETPRGENEFEHEHCQVDVRRREELLSPTGCVELIVEQTAAPIIGFDRDVASLTRLELLALAPKGSPPA